MSLQSLRSAELQKLAQDVGLDASGTKSELIDRLERANVASPSRSKSPSRSRSPSRSKPASDGGASPSRSRASASSRVSKSPSSDADDAPARSGARTAAAQSDQEETDNGDHSPSTHKSGKISKALDKVESKIKAIELKFRWMDIPRTVCKLLVLMEVAFFFFTLDKEEEQKGKNILAQFTGKFLAVPFIEAVFQWVLYFFFIPLVLGVVFNMDAVFRDTRYSVATFAIARFSIYYIFHSSFGKVFAYLPESSFQITCAVTLIFSFWDAIALIYKQAKQAKKSA